LRIKYAIKASSIGKKGRDYGKIDVEPKILGSVSSVQNWRELSIIWNIHRIKIADSYHSIFGPAGIRYSMG
jgi:hypothetical protein